MAQQTTIDKLVYPDYLALDEYKLRSIQLTAMTSDIGKKDSEEAIENADKTTLENLQQSISTTLKGVGDDLSSMLETNRMPNDMLLSGCIVLPLPNTLIDTQDHSWNEETSLTYKAISPLMNTSMSDIPVIGGAANMVGLSKLAQNITVSSAVNQLSHALGIRKPLADPGYFQSYSGSALRRFTMQWDFMPESVEEAQTINKIILKLKQWTTPSIGINGVVMLSPLYFKIEFGNPYITKMFNMNCCVCTNMQLDYGGDGSIQTYKDGFPKIINLSLAMAEARQSFADNYGSEYSKKSSGQSSSSTNFSQNAESAPTVKIKNDKPTKEESNTFETNTSENITNEINSDAIGGSEADTPELVELETTSYNGISHVQIYKKKEDGTLEYLKTEMRY